MRIGVNCVHLAPKSGEADIFLRNTLRALRTGHPEIELILFTDPVNDPSYEGWERVCVGGLGRESFFSRADSAFRRAVQSARIDRLLTPLATAPPKPPAAMTPFVMDLRVLDPAPSPHHWWGEVRPRDLRKAAARASTIIVPSEYARRRLLDGLSVPLERILVAVPGSDHVSGATRPCPVARPFLLSVCDPEDHDKIPALVQVYERVRGEIPHNLIIVGEPSELEPPDWGDGIMRIHSLPVEQLTGLYQNADLTICAVDKNGSGIKVLEALASGARVLVPRTGAIPDLARSAPIYCDPSSVPSMANALLHALEEPPEEHARRVRSGRQAVAEHTWARCADRVAAALRR